MRLIEPTSEMVAFFRGWADKTIHTRIGFNPEKTQFVYAMIAALDRQRADSLEP